MRNIFIILFVLFSTLAFAQPIRSGSYLILNKPHVPPVDVPLLPNLAITNPTDGQVIDSADVEVAAVSATDGDGTIDSVVFFVDDVRQAVDVSSPYTYSLSTTTPGDYELKAVAWDNDSQSRADSITYTINSWPTVTITAPTDSEEFTQGDSETGTANASDADGTVAYVEFYEDDILVATDVSSPFSQGLTTDGVGTIEFKAIAYDNDGRASIPDSVNFIVNEAPIDPGNRTTTELVPYFDMVVDPFYAEGDAIGTQVSDGDTVFTFTDLTENFTFENQSDQYAIHDDTNAFYRDNWMLDSNAYMTINNQGNQKWVASIGSQKCPCDVYYVATVTRSANYEKFFSGAFTIEDHNGSRYGVRMNINDEKQFDATGGDWLAPYNKKVGWHISMNQSGYIVLEIDTGTGWISYGDSVNVLGKSYSSLSTDLYDIMLGSNTRPQAHRMHFAAYKFNGSHTTAQEDSVKSIIGSIYNIGSFVNDARLNTDDSWSFNTTTNVYTWTHTATAKFGTIDSVHYRLHIENPSHPDGLSQIDGLTKRLDEKALYTGTFTFDRDDYSAYLNGSNPMDNNRIRVWVRFRSTVTGWGYWYESKDRQNNVQ